MIGTLICFVVMLTLQLLTPFWWWIMVVPFAYSLWRGRSGRESFFTGALSAGLLWLLAALGAWLTSAGFVTARVAQMFGLGLPWVMPILTSIMAAAAAGSAGGTGYLLRAARLQKS